MAKFSEPLVIVLVPAAQHAEALLWLWHASTSVDWWWEMLNTWLLKRAIPQPSPPAVPAKDPASGPAWVTVAW